MILQEAKYNEITDCFCLLFGTRTSQGEKGLIDDIIEENGYQIEASAEEITNTYKLEQIPTAKDIERVLRTAGV